MISDPVSTDVELSECAFGKLRYRGTWKRSPVEVLRVCNILEARGEFTELFLGEIQTITNIRHPNVSQIFGVSQVDSQSPCVVSELLDTTLKDRLRDVRPLSSPKRLFILLGVLNGLRYLHESSPPVVHGLLTADSVWMSRDLSQVKVTHLVTAKLLLEKGRPDYFHSFQHLVAPEVLQDRSLISTSSDIFSYGMLVLETLTGQVEPGTVSEALQSIGVDGCLLSVIQNCFVSADDRPTAKEVMNSFPKNPRDSTSSKDDDVDCCSSSSSESDEEIVDQTHQSTVSLRNENEILKKHVGDLEASIKSLTEESQRLQTVLEPLEDEVTADHQLESLNWAEEKNQLLKQLKDTKGFHKCKDLSFRHELSLTLPQEQFENIGITSNPHWQWQGRPDIPHQCETVMTMYRGKLLIGNRGQNKMYIIDVDTGELLKTAIYTESDASFDGIFVSDGKIYVALVNEVTWQLKVHTYSLEEDTWTLICERPPEVQLGAIALAVVTGRIITAGGFTRSGQRVDVVLMFSMAEGEWQLLPRMPRPRSGCSSFVYHGCVCYAGGSEDSRIKSNAVDAMSLETYEWKSLPSTTTRGGAVTTMYGTLIATGGLEDDTGMTSKRVEMWDPERVAWMPFPCLVQGRYFHEMCVDTEGSPIRVFVAGGYDKNKRKTSTVEVLEF